MGLRILLCVIMKCVSFKEEVENILTLIQLTEELEAFLAQLKHYFETKEPPESFSDRDRFNEMKKETAPIYNLLKNWEEQALKLIKQRKLNIHPQQIQSTKENIERIIVHSYYIDVRRRIYMELHQSTQYIFNQILRDLVKK